jgi:hypothetical protein
MTTSAGSKHGSGGGSLAIRGFLLAPAGLPGGRLLEERIGNPDRLEREASS